MKPAVRGYLFAFTGFLFSLSSLAAPTKKACPSPVEQLKLYRDLYMATSDYRKDGRDHFNNGPTVIKHSQSSEYAVLADQGPNGPLRVRLIDSEGRQEVVDLKRFETVKDPRQSEPEDRVYRVELGSGEKKKTYYIQVGQADFTGEKIEVFLMREREAELHVPSLSQIPTVSSSSIKSDNEAKTTAADLKALILARLGEKGPAVQSVRGNAARAAFDEADQRADLDYIETFNKVRKDLGDNSDLPVGEIARAGHDPLVRYNEDRLEPFLKKLDCIPNSADAANIKQAIARFLDTQRKIVPRVETRTPYRRNGSPEDASR